jgi:hypothetical protein
VNHAFTSDKTLKGDVREPCSSYFEHERCSFSSPQRASSGSDIQGMLAGNSSFATHAKSTTVVRGLRARGYGRGNASRHRIARRNGHERCTQLHFCPRLGLCHRLHAPMLYRLRTDLDRDAEVLVSIAPFDVRMSLLGL